MSAVGELVHGWRRSRWLVAAVACASLLALSAGPARAADGVIDGSPLNIYADDNGRLQVVFDGSTTGEFYPPAAAPANAGLNLAQTGSGTSNDYTVFGFQGLVFMPAIPPAVTGDGSPGNPWVLTTRFRTGGAGMNGSVRVDERISYVNGTTDVNVHYDVFNDADTGTFGIQARVYEAADLYVSGNDTGVGFFDPGPPRQVGGINAAQGSSGRLVEQTPWSHYQEGQYGDVFAAISGSSLSTQGFNDTVDPTLLDDGAGVQRNFDIPGQTTASFDVTWRFKHFTPLQLALIAQTHAEGQTATVNVSARNSDGGPDPGRAVRYAIAGANPSAGAVTTAADGNAAISWRGANQGTDTLIAFIDLNGNGIRDANEPQQQVTVTWTPPLPPVPGKSVVAQVVSGQVFIKYPAGFTGRATGPAKGFAPFTGAANIPVGSQLDTKKGRVKLTSAADTAGKKTQTSDFYQGIFQVKQALPKKKSKKAVALTTDLVLKGQIARSQCAPLKGAAVAAAKKKGPKSVLGKLWGNGKGKFRTTGKYSSATVRGTIWLTQDECDGTLTKVLRGTVTVRDIRRKKTVRVKAGHSYLARAQRAASKSKRRSR
jgi:hypothetical protein